MSFTKRILLGVMLFCFSVVVAPGSAVSATPHPEFGMVLYYPLDGGSVMDQSGFGRDGALTGAAVVADKWGTASGALNFNGSGDNVSIPAAATNGLSSFTFSMWVKTTESRTGSTYRTHPTIIGMATGGLGSGDFGVCLNNGRPGFFSGLIPGNDNSYYSATNINDNTWHHLAAVNDGVTIKLYIDGVLDTGGNIISGLALANTGFYLGKSNLPDPLGFAGSIDELRIYNRALSSEEILSLAQTASTPPTTVSLTISRTGAGGGSITINPSGLVCASANCGVVLPPSSNVILNVSPDAASVFSGWSGACSGAGDCSLTLTPPLSATASLTTLQTSLLARYPFNGAATDLSGNNNNGLVDGTAPSVDRFAYAGNAFSFDGIDNSVDLTGASSVSGSRTVSLWVNPHANTGYGLPILTAGPSGTADFLGVGATAGPCAFGSARVYLHHWGSACLDSNINLTTDAWNHLAISYDSDAGTITFYRNGVRVKSAAGMLYNYGISTVTVGGNSISGLTTKASFYGSLDDLTIFGRAMNDAEILSLYYRQGTGTAITSPVGGSSLASSVVTIAGTAKAIAGRQVGLVEVSVDGGNNWQSTVDTSGNGSWGTWSYSWQPPVVGGYTLMARARDVAGYYEIQGPGIEVQVKSLYTPSSKNTFNTGADFSAGLLDGVGTLETGLQLTSYQQPLPYLWVPNLNDTVSKVDTVTGRELGRYRTVPTGINGVNSRTTVDGAGNVWLGNRQAGSVVKIGLLENGQCLNRNGNGVIDTSRDTNGNGVIDSDEILPWGQDECVLVEVIVIPGKEGNYIPGAYSGGYVNDYWNPGPRSFAVDKLNNIWVGTYGTRKFYYISGTDGKILKTVDVASTEHSPYGATMDSDGNVWSSGNGSNVLKLDPKTDPPTLQRINLLHNVYGISADHQGHIFTSGTDNYLTRITAATGTVDWYIAMPGQGRGLAIDTSDNVWVAADYMNAVLKFNNSGALLAQISVSTSPTGVAIDRRNYPWAIGNNESIFRINPATNTVDLERRLPGSTGHYAYSDMTGIVSRTITTRTGAWSVLHDSSAADTPWGALTWTASIPVGASLQIKVRSSNDLTTWSDWETASNGSTLKATPEGRYLLVMLMFTAGDGGNSPVLTSLAIAPASSPLAGRDTTPPSGTIAINGGAVATNVTPVLLTLSATDDSGIVAKMRFSADGVSWGDWVSYETRRAWTLTTGDGPKNIYVQYRDVAGNASSPVHATIELHTTIPTTTATPAGGCFRSSQTVQLTADETATIYYTTDGSDPTTSQTAQTYNGGVSISTPTLLRFYAKDIWGYAETVKNAAFSFMTGTPLESITPASAGIPANGLKLWLRGDAGACMYLNDNKLSSWNDLSGNGNNVSGSGAVLLAGELNGKTVVKFDGSHTYAQTGGAVSAPYTVLAVARQDGSTRQRLISSASANWLMGYWSGKEDQLYAEGWVYQPNIVATNNAYLYTASGNGTISNLYRNGAKLAENGNGKSAPGLLSLGGSAYNGEPSDGKIAEVLLYNRVLSDSERKAVEAYLIGRYDLKYPLTVNITGKGSGVVNGSGISCSEGSCSAQFTAGAEVTLTATPATGSVFWGWTGLCSGAGPCTVTVDQVKNVTAVFDPLPHPEFDMILYYPMDGNATDQSGYGRNGALTGTTAATDPWGVTGKALSFNGSGDYIQAPSFAFGGGAFSVSAWVYVNNVGPSWQRIFDFGNGSNADNVMVTFTGSLMMLSIRHGSTYYQFTTSEAFPQQRWTHVTVTHDGIGVGKIYWNGALKATGTAPPPLIKSRSNQYIGKSNWSDPYFGGMLDEFRVYDRELSRTEIDLLAAVPPPAVGIPLVVNVDGAPGINNVTIDPGGVTCATASCSLNPAAGATVTLTAHPDSSSSFAGWSGDCSGGAATCTLTMSASRTVTATFNAFHAGLVAYYPFTGDADDASGNGLNGTVNGPLLTTNRFDAADRAYSFNGVNDYILVGDPTPTPLQIQKEISLQAWIYITEYPSNNLALIVGSQYDGSVSGATIFLDGRTNPDSQTAPAGHIHFQIGNGSWHSTNTSSAVPLNQWVHILATRRAYDDAKIYYNGVLQPSTSAPWTGGVTYNNAWFAMGRQKDLSRPFKGKIDDVRIYNRALSATEAQALYAEPASDYVLSVTIAGANGGGGSVHSVPAGISSISGVATANFANNTAVTLTESADVYSLFTGWSGDCTGTSDCQLTMNVDKTVTANFVQQQNIRLATTTTFYSALQSALNEIADGQTLLARNTVLPDYGGVIFGKNGIRVFFKGGYESGFTNQTGVSSVYGPLKILSGTLVIDRLAIK